MKKFLIPLFLFSVPLVSFAQTGVDIHGSTDPGPLTLKEVVVEWLVIIGLVLLILLLFYGAVKLFRKIKRKN